MSTSIILSYLLIVVGIVVWVVFIPGRRHMSPKLMTAINIFGGAFLFASCFINLLPHMFLCDDPYRFATPGSNIKVAAAVMVGFLIQLLLEQLTHGTDHGHDHLPDSTHNSSGSHGIFSLLVGLCIHAFLEGMPLVESEGDIHLGLLYGIVLHNIPIAMVLVGLFISHRYSFWRSLSLLLLFAIMTPLGSICNLTLIPENPIVQSLLMGVVIGILLHVSVHILFDRCHNTFSWHKLLLIVVAFAAAYFTPGCPEVYGF